MKVDLKGLSLAETEAWVKAQGLPVYRAKQLRQWLFKGLVTSFKEMTNISKSLRAQLEEKACITHLVQETMQVSKDRTTKFLFKLEDGHFIETVLIPERGHFTLCISSQAGCAMGCRFCLTARQGLKRNLTAAEILDQVIHVKRSMSEPDRLTNIVFMGMGEPLANYDAVVRALGNLISEEGMNFSHRTVTLSTWVWTPNPQTREGGQGQSCRFPQCVGRGHQKFSHAREPQVSPEKPYGGPQRVSHSQPENDHFRICACRRGQRPG